MGVFPAIYPRELLWAFNILPVEVWDPPVDGDQARAHLQPYICSVVRTGLGLILSGRIDGLDGLLFPHTCDSIQNAASIVHDYLETDLPSFFFQLPREPYSAASKPYYRAQLEHLAESLSRIFGPPDQAELELRTAQGERIRARLAELYALRSSGLSTLSNSDFYSLLRKSEYFWPDDLEADLDQAFVGFNDFPEQDSPAVLLSGIRPGPPGLIELFDELGVRLGLDDLLSGLRRIPRPNGSEKNPGEPLERLTQAYFNLPPCPTRNSSIEDRLAYLTELVELGSARGIIFNTVKFCEPELFDLPNLTAGLKAAGVSCLVIETEVDQPIGGQVRTRIEAFLEMTGCL